MAIKFSNLASTTLASGVSDTATSLSVTSASSFPSLGGSDYFYASIGRGSGSEIVKVTALSGTTLTVVRGQDDTTAISHASGVEFALRVTAASLNDLSTQADTESVSIAGDTMTGSLTVPALDITGNTTTSGTIDGRDVAADGTKLDGIESGATADQTASEIKTAYESNSDTNAFTDAAESKLSGIEASADVTDTTNVTAAGALMDSEVTNLTQVKAFDSSDYATAAQGTTADDALPKSGGAMTGAITTNSTFDGRDVATDGTKLDGIEANATADQTNAEIRAAVEAASDSNAFTDADHSKLNAIEAGATADQTAAEIKTAYESNSDTNAFTDADHSKLNGIAANANNYVLPSGYATENYVNTQVTNLVDSSPATLNTLNELAAALGDDPNFATTTANSIGTKASLSGAAFTGAITTNSTIDGRDVATDGTKLDGIEASADVTDTANVTAAGALMDSELTAIASVKGLDQGVATTDSPSFVNLTLSGTGSVKVPSGTTAQRDGSPVNGMFRYNSSNQQFEGYQSGDWGAIGGGGGSNTFTADTFTANGSTTAYALSQVINSENNLLVFIDGVFQQQSAYSIATASGTTTLTFSTAPANTREIIVYSVASAVSGSNLNTDSMTGDGSDVTLALSIAPVSENNTQVFIDGVYQNKDTYSISGTTLTFSTAPPTGSAVEVMTMTQTEVNVPVDGTITSAKLSGDLTLPGDLSFADNSKALFGAGSDLQIYHDGNNSYINDAGTGALLVRGSNVSLAKYTGETMVNAFADGRVDLYYDNAIKLTTVTGGIDVTGTATMDGLTVDGNVESLGTFILNNGTDKWQNLFSTNDLIIRNNHNTSWYNRLRISYDGDISFYEDTGTTPKLFWDASAESLGIGTSSPDQLLQLGSETYGANAIIKTQVDGSDAGDFDAGLHMRSHNDDFGGSIVLESRSSTNDIINFKYHNNSSAGVSAMAIDATNGKVGIGTSSPSTYDSRANNLVVGDSGDAGVTIFSGATSDARLVFAASGDTGLANGVIGYDNNNDSLAFEVAGSERMRIDSSGNVGIGTSSPNGNGILTLNTPADNSAQIVFAENDTAKWLIGHRHDGDYFRFYDLANSAERMRIDSSGNLLVGKTSTSQTTAGTVLYNNGQAYSTASGTQASVLTRLSNDGPIQIFYKDSSEVGRIGSNAAGGTPVLDISANSSSGIMRMLTSGTERMRIDSSGNVGIGVSPSQKLHVYQSATGSQAYVTVQNNRSRNAAVLTQTTNGGFYTGTSIGTDTLCWQVYDVSAGERMRIDSSGNLLVGTTAVQAKLTVAENQASGFVGHLKNSNVYAYGLGIDTGSGNQIFFYLNGSNKGSIISNSSGTAYNTTSDQRLKENIADADDAGSKIDSIQVRKYDWKADGSHQDYGMVAQELQLVAPEAVSVPEDSEEMMGVDYSKLVPMLIKEIQSLRNRVAQLEE